jgi:fumarate reductase flavoprotein subunit
LIAAAKTAEAGKQVILLEKLPKLGGGSQFAQGLRMFSTKMDAEAGVPDQMDDYIRSALNTCRWEIDPRLIANAFHALPECFDWMCEWAPVQDSWAVTVSPFGNKMVNTKNGRDAGWFVTQNMEQRCREKGVTILTQHTAKKLVMEQGKVTGVVAEDAGGEVHISCKACLMATGNISYGEVLKKTLPSYYFADSYANSHRMPGNTGDHISMAEDAGISVDYDSVAAAYLGGMIAKGVEGPMMQHVDRGEALKVNKNGKRWINESVNSESAIWAQIKQPGCASFTILDKAILDSKAEAPYRPVVNRTGRNIGEGIPGPDGKFSQNVSFGPPGGHGGPGGPGGPGGAPVDAETALRRAAEYQGGHVFVADTLEELAQKAGIPVESFTATVARYNELCEKGHDDDFYKLPNYLKPIQQAPFFAIRCHMATDGVFGGLDADENVNVLSHGAPVEGLYCAGDTIGNRYINQGGEKLECINDFSWAFASGYLAAKKMLEYLQ